jgi:hypothetical protein
MYKPVIVVTSLAEAHKRADLLDDDNLIAWTRYMQSIVEDYAGKPKVALYAPGRSSNARARPDICTTDPPGRRTDTIAAHLP